MEMYQGMDGTKKPAISAHPASISRRRRCPRGRLIAVVMGGDTPGWRDEHMAELMNQGFATPNPGAAGGVGASTCRSGAEAGDRHRRRQP